MNGSSESMGLTVAASPSTGHRTQALRLADREQEALEDNARRAFSDVDGLISSPGSSFQTLGAMSDISEGATLLGAMGSHLEDGSSDKAAALKAKRKCERLRKKATKDIIGAGTQRRVEFVGRSLKVAQEDFAIEDTIHSEQGYEGVRDGGCDWRDGDAEVSRLEFLRYSRGYLAIDTSRHDDVDIPLADADGRIWAVILGEPKGWDTRRKGIRAARDRLERQTAHLAVHPNRRGDFQSFNYGFSFGNGRTNPMNFVNGPTVQAALTEFYEDEHVQAMFLYAENAIQTWFPDHRTDFHHAITSCQTLHPELITPVPGSSFPASTVNVGPRVNCLSHRDSSNIASGICLDYIDGDYDPLTGGHLVFHEAMRIIRVRPGGIVIFPSAVVTHETIPVKPHETRFSITGYLAGAIPRYLDAGGRTLTTWRKVDPEAAARSAHRGDDRWNSGCERFKTASDLISYWSSRI